MSLSAASWGVYLQQLVATLGFTPAVVALGLGVVAPGAGVTPLGVGVTPLGFGAATPGVGVAAPGVGVAAPGVNVVVLGGVPGRNGRGVPARWGKVVVVVGVALGPVRIGWGSSERRLPQPCDNTTPTPTTALTTSKPLLPTPVGLGFFA